MPCAHVNRQLEPSRRCQTSLMRLVIISPPVDQPGEHTVLRALFARGLQIFHLRKPGHTLPQLREFVAALPPEYLGRVVTHQHHSSLVAEYGVKGLHLRERDREAGTLGRLPGLTLSTSIHDLQQLAGAGDYDYVFLSPVFDSISKEGYAAAFPDREALRTAVAASPCPVYALGGVTDDKLCEVRRLGFAGAALLGTIWQASDPVAAYEAAARECRRLGAVER